MKIFSRRSLPFISIILLAFLVFVFSIWDIINNEQWLERVIALYGILIILTLLFLVSKEKRKSFVKTNVDEFEKSLKGKLYHFKCPFCGGIFAIKKSKHNNKKPFTLTCPDCGTTGTVPSKPFQILGEIPEMKSVHKNFKCEHCGEWIMVWAEGTDIISDIHVHSCPYCGTKRDMSLV
ncbi:MAG TPA: hypothetical protein DSN98_02665 [Thermoplasmata archaeon]|jgi:predicted RNA-binding Zn-ribbon protein involved in translation (DUF1610 family)|nr:MAG TPA: hypothetical protein DSN98_02665 [Thermoplasmata archaeon]